MTDPVTAMTAGAIASLAFQKFVEAGAGRLAEKFTEAGVEKIEALWEMIRGKLAGQSPKVDEALIFVEDRDEEALDKIISYLNVEMDKDEVFAQELQQLAHEITLTQKQGDGGQIQNNFGGTNFQNQISGGTVNQGTININQGPSKG